ncbi:tRNA (adenosine(37)-N6)-threonylcarbamoyltransferase complex transferase subunit TsaD [Calorimonas adulescens]|jgi:O-sialoglycoprotein endopeptidase (EC 3.4.24.57)|uniref:tRNA N6-adenosine threonylcarbamoyltransferase n=1 Tax=Calorimonas adulescens TaxID=2606906 RepID=A0A5D8QDD2_9THEO|nr:tRNA (adenosine(37)-N6)-threonylcarbamoyltransferase complex transferase subunit TsaD [Calorimonas adulescens]TZE82532.1 tRNA (adenosine(37)-N6)-threonylcarbamoyltransferase complex transferase subunit TsaD [Calorimonas adulescens]
MDILTIGIESSCDETSVAVVKNGREVLSNIISSQVEVHKIYGGVVPEIASRRHIEVIDYLLDEALEEAGISLEDIDVVGVTAGPGLIGSLLVGVSYAKGLAFALGKPLVGVNHIAGHISANFIEHRDLEPPLLCLVASGGHSHIVGVRDYTEFEIIGKTTDDAAGEAFDKVARILGLPYPGGPNLEKLAAGGDPCAYEFPKSYPSRRDYNFSFSGVKTAVLNLVNSLKMRQEPVPGEDIAASFQKNVVEVLIDKLINAAIDFNYDKVAIAGGVSSNKALRQKLKEEAEKAGLKFYYPAPVYCTDNAAMIACNAYYEYLRGNISDMTLNAYPHIGLKRIG